MIQIKKELENKIPDNRDLVKKTNCIAKITETQGKIPSISSLAANSVLTTVEKKNLILVA